MKKRKNWLTMNLVRSIINSQLKGVLEFNPAETKKFFRTREPDLDNASVGNVYSLS